MRADVLAEIVREAAARFAVDEAEVLAPSNQPGARCKSAAAARRYAMALARLRTGCSYPELGRAFGRDHTSCIVGVRKARREHPELCPVEVA